MSQAPGTRLGPYEILSLLGAGGMGEVYRARDSRLGREVAIKVLPSHLSSSPDVRQRFEREAKTISALSHPHICALYDVGNEEGVEYLVMEYLEGETLAGRLSKGALPLEQTLRFGVEIADALDKAHRQGIVHRDLKPGNVMLTKSGVKLLDFGLAKVFAPTGSISGVTALPTMAGSTPLTQEGTILGTFQYMAPEQLEGREADGRSDVFAFGAVLYEMATGRKAFEGKSQASLIASILTSEPPSLSTIQPMTPPALDRVVRTCLAKDPDDRWQSAHDIASELKWIAQGSQAGAPAPAARAASRRREWIAWGVAAVGIAAALVASAALVGRGRAIPERPVRLSLTMPEKSSFDSFDHVVVSPDGRLVGFIAHAAGGKRSIWLRPLSSSTAAPLAGTEAAVGLFWSPGGTSIGFFADGKLKRIEAAGGPPQVLADADAPFGGAWNRDGTILFAPSTFGPLFRIPATGGKPLPATKLGEREDSSIWPCFLPDGRHFVFLADASSTLDHAIRMGSLDSLESVKLVPGAVTNLGFAPPDWLLFVRAGTLVAQRLDVKGRKVSGDPIPLGDQVAQADTQHGFDFSTSAIGTLVYRSENYESQLAWFDRAGKRLSAVGEPARYGHFDLSPDERQVAFERLDADLRHGNLWLIDVVRGSTSRLTATMSSDYSPIWSRDGKRILYGSARSGLADIYEMAAGGGGGEKLVFHDGTDKNVASHSSDGRFALISVITPATRDDVWLLPLGGGGKPTPLLATRFSEIDAQLSPDDRWLAYSSDESGRYEVYVQSLADSGTRIRVSTSGGVRPRWRSDGKVLFFVAGEILQEAAIRTSPSLEAESPRDLFHLKRMADYAVARDGRILAAVPAEDTQPSFATVVLNWTSGLPK
ncbi:MAG: serine/threonine-protein kinase [Acidobacteria bacterium]|nr:serine/threonine-protein kinase [Acidobacteriota bacterium]